MEQKLGFVFIGAGVDLCISVAAPSGICRLNLMKEKAMAATYSYACKEFPGMEACPAHFHAETYDELWKIIELHASVAHGEDPAAWPAEDIAQIKALIKSE